MRPLVGIPCHAGVGAESERPIFYNNRAYVHAVERAGGVPILIPILDDLNGLNTLLPRLDGLLISGGIDVDPRNYQEEPHPRLGRTNPKLDDMEIELVRWALQENIPLLGICRGMQILNVALGGSLYQDLEELYPDSLKHPNWELPRNHIAHTIAVEPGSRMAEILGESQIPTNSLHHQGVKKVGEGVTVSGRAEDGVVELIEVNGPHFMLAAQCHPEELHSEHPAWARLFKAFIQACEESALRKVERVETLTASAV
ncbi:gamma-glutamyl-gamma-aminobutyrate hydrolase [Reticulibacter mediterranei]|uniref:Gamma-glutamyl-gamma-aminobutyrate hydrolase n=1 Tax=Reticulibacter mediterranei TaxID=2778369 RepID=A0A8J3ILJ3_9CHLR|nr:gamma-glutamyl-gamma-aminobutyrate hydrolase family protein [Reticulibacter mediterranei]GHO93739.1 gamma-glutamyl-gamma-aminobutyrate hydrolase [Reticulibacter mediterranei]